MKKRMILSFVLVLGLILYLNSALASPEDFAGQVLSDFSVNTINGTVFTLSESLKTHDLVLINFWATWCGPCRMEFPGLEMAWEQYSDRVDVIALSIEKTDTLDKLTEFAGENNLEFLIGRDDSQMFDSMGGTAIPTTIIVDQDRRVVVVEIGAKTSAEDFTNLFDSLLDTSEDSAGDAVDQPVETSEATSWDCPECGRTGNTRNYCGGCGHPAPWMETAQTEEPHTGTIVPEENATPGAIESIVRFGNYEQDNNTGNGKEPIEWIVLDVDSENKKALLISRYVLDTQIYYKTYTDVSWEKCNLRNWLNNTFLKTAFSSSEQKAILKSTLNNDFSEQKYDNSEYSKPGATTTDKVFLLSYNELWNKYMPKKQERMAKATPYALAQGAWTVTSGEYKDYSIWMLRTTSSFADAVDLDGDWTNARVDMPGTGIRPAIWIDSSSDLFN